MSEPVHVYTITHLPAVSGLPRAREVEIWRGDTYRSYAVAACGKPLRKHISMHSYNRAVRYRLAAQEKNHERAT